MLISGTLELRLDEMHLPLKQLPFIKSKFHSQYVERKMVSLFEQKKVRGLFPVYGPSSVDDKIIVTVG